MIYTFASEEASGISSLGLNVKAFIFQLITFVIIIWILNKFALKRIFATIEQRRIEVEESLKNAELAKVTLAKADDKADEIVEEARVKADALQSDAQAEASETVKAAETKASQKAERILASRQFDFLFIDGDHEWLTFREALPEALQYVDRACARS